MYNVITASLMPDQRLPTCTVSACFRIRICHCKYQNTEINFLKKECKANSDNTRRVQRTSSVPFSPFSIAQECGCSLCPLPQRTHERTQIQNRAAACTTNVCGTTVAEENTPHLYHVSVAQSQELTSLTGSIQT